MQKLLGQVIWIVPQRGILAKANWMYLKFSTIAWELPRVITRRTADINLEAFQLACYSELFHFQKRLTRVTQWFRNKLAV